MARFIFVTGGVVSSLGKGLLSASLGALLQARGYKVRIRKFDPYLNVDPGTMSPYQHGEVFVTDDGAETDLDLGHYERFTGVSSRQSDNITTGRIYRDIIAQGAARRLSLGDRPGHSARHQRDQGIRARDTGELRLRDLRDRRNRRRHRKPAIHRIDPAAQERSRPRPYSQRPHDARAVDRGRRRAQDQADATIGARAFEPRRPARSAAVPLRPAAARGRAREDRLVLQRPEVGRHPRARRAEHLRRAAAIS